MRGRSRVRKSREEGGSKVGLVALSLLDGLEALFLPFQMNALFKWRLLLCPPLPFGRRPFPFSFGTKSVFGIFFFSFFFVFLAATAQKASEAFLVFFFAPRWKWRQIRMQKWEEGREEKRTGDQANSLNSYSLGVGDTCIEFNLRSSGVP